MDDIRKLELKLKSVEIQATEDAEAEAWKKNVKEAIYLVGGILFTPVIILVGACYGVCFGLRAGAIAGLGKTLEWLTGWGEEP